MKKIDLTGQKYNRLLALHRAPHPSGRPGWMCRCDCGVEKIIKQEDIRSGDTKSCGCLNKEKRSARAKAMYRKIIKYEPRVGTATRIWKKRYGEMKFNDFFELSQQNCYYCGSEPDNLQNAYKGDPNSAPATIAAGDFRYSGLDRVDNNLPHTRENCVPSCKFCNYAKRDRSVKDFEAWAERLFLTIQARKATSASDS